MLKDTAVKKIRITIPKGSFQIPPEKELIGVHVVIEDFYMSLDPIVVIDNVYSVTTLTDSKDEYGIVLQLPLNYRSNLAMKYRYVFNDKGVSELEGATYSEFSLPTSFYGNQEGVKLDGLVILTPELKVEEKYSEVNGDLLHIVGSEFRMPIAEGEHKATNWKIYNVNDTDEVVFQRRSDKTHLRELYVDLNKFDPRKLYAIECSYVSSTNNESLTGRLYYNRIVEITDTSRVKPILPFFNTYDMFFRVDIKNPQAKSLIIKVYAKEDDGSKRFWKSVECDISSYAYIPQGELSSKDIHGGIKNKTFAADSENPSVFDPNGLYTCYYEIKLLNDTLTREEKICDFRRMDSEKFVYPDAVLKYPGKYTAMYPIQTGDFICCSQELQGGVILLGNYTDNSISFFKREELTIRDLGFKLELPGNIATNTGGYPIFNVIQANDGIIYINYPIYESINNGGSYNKRSAWIAGKINPVTYRWKQVASATYKEEIMVDRAVAAVSGIEGIYYIPQGILKNPDMKAINSFNNQDLANSALYHLRVVNGTNDATLVRTKVIDNLYPSYVTGFALTSDEGPLASRRYYILAGMNPVNNKLCPLVFEVEEDRLRKVWKEKKQLEYPAIKPNLETAKDNDTKEVRNVVVSRALTFLGELPTNTNIGSFDSVTVVPRGDGTHILFNNSTTGGQETNSSVSILNFKVTAGGMSRLEYIDSQMDVPFTNTVQLRDGGFLRLTTNLSLDTAMEGLKHILYYTPVNLKEYNDYIVESEKTLIVRRNRRVKVIDLKRYEKIIIEGDNTSNTGKLIYIDNGVVKEFDYMDFIVTRDMSVTQQQADEHAMKRLYLLDGVNYEIRN